MALSTGDLAFVSYNSDTDRFAFVALQDIEAGETVRFTDAGWLLTDGFRSGEGTINWTTTARVAAGTVVTIVSSASLTVTTGTVTMNGTFELSTVGDQIIAYQGFSFSPTLIAAINVNDGGSFSTPGDWDFNAVDENSSALPAGLFDGGTAISLEHFDNRAYNGSLLSGSPSALRSALGNENNWSANDTSTQFPPASFTVAPTVFGDRLTGTSGNDNIDLLGGDDVYRAGAGIDTIIGGAGVDTLYGEDDDDLFIVSAADTGDGELYDGGGGTDTLLVTGGGVVDISGATLTSIEAISTFGTSTELVVADETVALLIAAMGGSEDVVTIDAWTGGSYEVPDLFSLLTGRGIEEVRWTQSIHAFSAVLDGATGFVDVTAQDFGDARDYLSIVNAFDSDGDLRRQVKTDDDGAVITTNYDVDGVITDRTIDASAASPGRSYAMLVDTYTNGLLDLSVLTATKTGVTTTKDYDVVGPASVLRSSLREDVDGWFTWHRIEETYDASGALTGRLTTNDAGEAVASIDLTYAGGVLTERLIDYSDGRSSHSFLTGGVVDLTVNTTASGERSMIGGSGNNSINGTSVGETLVGGAGNDTLVGAGGSDVLNGGTGTDTLTGGDGADVFVFSSGMGKDVVTDFANGEDLLNLRAFGVTGTDALSGDFVSKGFSATDDGAGGTIIDLGPLGLISLTGFAVTDLDASDFY